MISVWLAITTIPNVWTATVMWDQLVYHVTTKVNAHVRAISMERIVTSAKKTSTISHCVNLATVIQLELSRNLQAVAQFLRESCVSVRNVLKAEFATNVVLYTGIWTSRILMAAKNATVSLTEQSERWTRVTSNQVNVAARITFKDVAVASVLMAHLTFSVHHYSDASHVTAMLEDL